MTPILEAALELAAKEGYPLVPCRDDKRPLERGWTTTEWRTEAEVRKAFANPAAKLIGVRTGHVSGLLVVDIDPRNGGNTWYRENGSRLSCRRIHQTRSGGWHLLYQMPTGSVIKNSAGSIAPGVDIRAEGGQIIWWPSHACPVELDDSVGPPPPWLVEAIMGPSTGLTDIGRPNSRYGQHPKGGRNQALARVAGMMRSDGQDLPELQIALLTYNAKHCDPPLDEAEVRSVAASICERYPRGETSEERAALCASLMANARRLAERAGLQPKTAGRRQESALAARNSRRFTNAALPPTDAMRGPLADKGFTPSAPATASCARTTVTAAVAEAMKAEGVTRDQARAAVAEELADALKNQGLATEEARDAAAATLDSKATWREEIDRLAKLPGIEYDRERDHIAKALGCRVTTLDEAVRKSRGDDNDDGQGAPMAFDDPEPWGETVDTGRLLNAIRSLLTSHLVLPPHADVALTLWTTWTWVFNAFDTAPLLLLSSPEKRCGKTRTIGMLSRLVHRPLPTSNSSSAALFRVVEEHAPTLLIDEADTFLGENPELRGIINSGFTRDAAFVLRTQGDDHQTRHFSTWSPKAIAMIRQPIDTIVDRAIVVPMARKPSGVRVQRLRHRDRFSELRRKLARWSADNADAMGNATPAMPEILDDRAADKWEPLFAIADLAGGAWPLLARAAAVALSAAIEDSSLGVDLLTDIRLTFEAAESPTFLTTKDLLERLCAIEERPWKAYGRLARELSANQLARLLKPYGVRPTDIRPPGGTPVKGYRLEALQDAFVRYLTPPSPLDATNPRHRDKPRTTPDSRHFPSATPTKPVAVRKRPKLNGS